MGAKTFMRFKNEMHHENFFIAVNHKTSCRHFPSSNLMVIAVFVSHPLPLKTIRDFFSVDEYISLSFSIIILCRWTSVPAYPGSSSQPRWQDHWHAARNWQFRTSAHAWVSRVPACQGNHNWQYHTLKMFFSLHQRNSFFSSTSYLGWGGSGCSSSSSSKGSFTKEIGKVCAGKMPHLM